MIFRRNTCFFQIIIVSLPREIKSITIMEVKKTKEQALEFIKAAVKHKQEWKKELEAEFKGKDINVVML